jgi:transcriptional regulator with XRE-family HTH domain
MKKSLTLGEFIAKKRHEHNYSVRELGTKLGITHAYLVEIEVGKRTNPSNAIIQKLIVELHLDKEEIALLYDLHGKVNGVISQDLLDYTIKNDFVLTALRKARDKPALKEDWQAFIDRMD